MFPRFALEGIAHDAVFHNRLLRAVLARPDSALIIPSLLPFTSLFVAESHDRLREYLPGFRVEPSGAIDLVRQSRHRTKLLLSRSDHLTEIVAKYANVAADERAYFSSLHQGFFAPLKRVFQSDLGFCTVDGQIFSTTHGTRFICGVHGRDSGFLHNVGYLVGAYCTQLIAAFAPKLEVPAFPTRILGRIRQTDIKSASLYSRGSLGTIGEEWAAVLTMVLANLNLVQHVLIKLSGADNATATKLRTLQCFNTIHSIRRVQDRLRGEHRLPKGAATILGRAISSPEAKWLRRRDDLRDMLVHFTPRKVAAGRHDLSLDEAIAHFSGASSSELAATTTALLNHLTETLAEGFNLGRDAFWYGRLPDNEAG